MEEMIEKIEKILKKKTTNNKALSLFEHNNVVSFEVDSHMSPELNFVFAMVKDPKYHEVDLAIQKNDLKLVNARCNCENFKGITQPCEHVGAALYKYTHQFLPKITPQEVIHYDDDLVKSLVQSYRSATIHHLIAENKNLKASLKVQLHFVEQRYLGVSLKVGIDKYYVIKDVQGFLEMIALHEQKKYGKDLDLYHHIASFDEASQKVITFLMNAKSDHSAFKSNPTTKALAQAKNFYLSDARIHQFLTLLEEESLNFGLHEQEDFNVWNTNVEFELLIKKHAEKAYRLELIQEKYDFIYDGTYAFIELDQKLYRCDPQYSTLITPLLQLFKNHRQITISINMMQDFYINIIEPLKNDIKLVGDRLDDLKPSIFTAKVFLDVVAMNTISAKLIFTYGDLEINAILKNPYDIVRNYPAELAVIMVLKKYFKFVDDQNGVFILDNSIDLIYEFFKNGFDEVSQYANIYTSDKVKAIKIKDQISMSVGVKINSDLLEIDLSTKDFPLDELSSILQAYREHKKYYRMRNGSFVNLDESGLNELSMFLDNLNVKPKEIESGKITTSTYRALSLDQTLQQASNLKVERDAKFKQIVGDVHNVKDSLFEVPPSLKDTLRNYQKEGYRWMKTMSKYGFGGILADDMGIGKTIQVITLLEEYRLHGAALPSIVVCPSSLILNWYNEIQKFAPQMNVALIHGSSESRASIIKNANQYNVLITSYDYIKRDVDLYEPLTFHYQILDEAQYIKNQNTKNAITVKQLNAIHRFALTGTPIENSLAEIWSIFDYLMPDYLYTYPFFKKHFEVGIVKYEDEHSLESLRKMVEPFILRRVKKDVLKELPDKIESTLYLELDEEAEGLYQANILAMKTDLLKQQAAGQENKILVLSMLTKLRQICCDPRLIYENITQPSIKVQAVMDIVESAKESGKKVLIFSQFTSVFKLLKQEFAQADVSYFTLTGKTSKEERNRMVNEFNTDETNVFMISLKAGGTGLNLTGAEVVIHFDPWWNLSAQNQATDRAYRLGQKNNVQVYKLICKDTIEEKILKLQNLKKDLADSIIFENENLIAKMSIDEIMDLF